MAQTKAFVWDQGADLLVQMIYKEGATAETAVAVDLSSNYAVRMDIVVPSTKERIYTFNSEELADVDPLTTGAQPDSVVEGVLSSGASGTPNISITVPRSLTLPGGSVYEKFTGAPSVGVYNYDVFLRNTSSDKQSKILQGTITINESYTLWL
jgi:hypothetical protein